MLELTDPFAPDLIAACDENIAAHSAALAAIRPGSRVSDTPGLLVVDSGLPCDTFNVVARARLDGGSAARVAAEVVGGFRAAGRPFAWWVGPADTPAELPGLLLALGLSERGRSAGMALDLRGWNPPPAAAGVAAVTTEAGVAEWAAVVAANWEPPDPSVPAFYAPVAAAVAAGSTPVRLFVARADGRAVAAAELCLAFGVAGLYGVATLAAERRKGYAAAVVSAALAEAKRHGYRTAVLQSSPEGMGVYRRLGFVPAAGEYVEYG